MKEVRARTKSADDTRALAAELVPLVRPGDIIVLSGDLGAGKTVFVQGFGRALGVFEPITSPTFVLVRRYIGELPLVHVDVYRLDRLQELEDLGLAEVLDERGVTLIEWGDAVARALPSDLLEVRFEFGDDPDERLVGFRCIGPTWPNRMVGVRLALERWLVD